MGFPPQPAARRPCVGVISNWDERLPQLLDALGAARHFDFVLTSREVGAEKPAALIFERARELAGVPAGARALHIGDSVGNDVAGAAAVGWEAVYAKPAAKRARLGAAERAALEALPHHYVEDLSEHGSSDRVVRRFYCNRHTFTYAEDSMTGRHQYVVRVIARPLPEAAPFNGHRRMERQLVGFRMCF